jgi:addiction module HigA family antidote
MTNGASASGSRVATRSMLKSPITTEGTSPMKKSLFAIHPGDFLAEILAELGVSQAEFARGIGVSPMRVSHVVRGSRPVTADLALLFGKALAQSPEYWLNLQAAYDLATARKSTVGRRLKDVATLARVA